MNRFFHIRLARLALPGANASPSLPLGQGRERAGS